MERTRKQFRKRNAILDYVRHSDQHPSAETIFEALKPEIPDLSLGTVYRNLSLFKQEGLIQSLGTVNGVERFDGIVSPHVHFICSHCARIRDLHQVQVPDSLRKLAADEANATVEQSVLLFFGLCDECRRDLAAHQDGEAPAPVAIIKC